MSFIPGSSRNTKEKSASAKAGRWILFGDDERYKDQEVIRVETPPCAAKFAEAHPDVWKKLSEEERLVYKGPAACKKALAAHKREMRSVKNASNAKAVVGGTASPSGNIPMEARSSMDSSPLTIQHPQPRYPTNFGGSIIKSTSMETIPSVSSMSSASTSQGRHATSQGLHPFPNGGPSTGIGSLHGTRSPMDISVTPSSNVPTDAMLLALSTTRNHTSVASSTGGYQRQHGQHSVPSSARYVPYSVRVTPRMLAHASGYPSTTVAQQPLSTALSAPSGQTSSYPADVVGKTTILAQTVVPVTGDDGQPLTMTVTSPIANIHMRQPGFNAQLMTPTSGSEAGRICKNATEIASRVWSASLKHAIATGVAPNAQYFKANPVPSVQLGSQPSSVSQFAAVPHQDPGTQAVLRMGTPVGTGVQASQGTSATVPQAGPSTHGLADPTSVYWQPAPGEPLVPYSYDVPQSSSPLAETLSPYSADILEEFEVPMTLDATEN
ncbi:hypothetical protein C8Q79DRAFT_1121560 [Trametes meyenii]|nr:hypothetical protein C8Q79DRAFT_1121560 [Trametes meyenii]